jgi:glycine cleavage system H protein
METPNDRKYSKEHEWVLLQPDGTARVGISHFAQDQLGDVVYVELPKLGATIEQYKQMGEVESVKAVSDLFSPVTGEVVEINEAVGGEPELLNTDPYDKGWLLRVKLADATELDSLLDASQYDAST